MDWKCPHCHQLFNFEKHQQKGAHITNCALNPKRPTIIAKQIITSTLPRIELVKDCPKCGKSFTQFKTEREIETGKDVADFCSRACANSHIISDAQREKTSQSLMGREYPERWITENRRCVICEKYFECYPTDKQQTCSRKCGGKLISKKFKGTGKTGGYRTKSGTSKFYGSYYKNIWMDSSWEVALATRLDELNIIWERDNKRFFNYIDIDGNTRKYYPDFYLPQYNLYLECKGYWTLKVRHKMQDVQVRNNFNLLILEDIKLIKSFNIPISI